MWWPHITRVNAKALQDTVEFRDILGDGEAVEDLQHLLSTFDDEIEISETVLQQAQSEVPKVGYETRHLYMSKDHKPGVFTGDGSPPNGAILVGSGTAFPNTPAEDDYFLRTDFNPHRLFIRKGSLWTKVEDDVRRAWQAANAIVTTFISNTGTITSSGEVDSSKQGLSRALQPRADF